MYLLTSFIVQNIKKSLEQIQGYEQSPLLGLKLLICPKWEFFSEEPLI